MIFYKKTQWWAAHRSGLRKAFFGFTWSAWLLGSPRWLLIGPTVVAGFHGMETAFHTDQAGGSSFCPKWKEVKTWFRGQTVLAICFTLFKHTYQWNYWDNVIPQSPTLEHWHEALVLHASKHSQDFPHGRNTKPPLQTQQPCEPSVKMGNVSLPRLDDGTVGGAARVNMFILL